MKSVKQVLLMSAGVVLIAAGIVGLFLPVLQGWVMIFLGLSLIAPRLARRLRLRFFRRFFKRDVVPLEEWKKHGVRAGFTTRHFPLVLKKTEDLLEPGRQKEFFRLFPLFSAVALPGQVHGDRIEVFEDALRFSRPGVHPAPEADGLLTNIPGLTLLVFSADCLPLFYRAGDWVGLAHAGWRGTKAGLAAKMAGRLSEKSGLPPSRLEVLFGPSISANPYEVGEEFAGYFPPSSLRRRNGKLHFDLMKENERQLVEAGILPNHIADHGICTYSENEAFYSFRKEGDKAGRVISFITRS